MRKLLAVAAVVAGFLAMAVPVDASLTNNTIGATAARHGHGANAKGTVLVTCTAGQQVKVTLTLTQGVVTGTGRTAARCTGQAQEIKVTVPARHGKFTAGNAAACAHADNRATGAVVEQRSWCRAGGVTLS